MGYIHRIAILFLSLWVFPLNGQIFINEIAVKPNPSSTDNCVQSLKECTNSTCGNEYVEFYNNSDCPVDIGCYIFVTESWDGARDGAFRFPSGTVIPGKQFLSIGGANSGASINLFTYCGNNHMLTANSRWYLENGDAWCALYDATGNLVDAVFWSANAGESGKWPADTDLDDTPPYIPTATASSCPAVGALSRPANTVGTGANQIEYAGVNPALGLVLERTTDGGTGWAQGAGTLNNCNGTCNTLGTCGPLPIELYAFELNAVREDVFVTWLTESEAGTDFFRIERSRDGTNWEVIGSVQAIGNSNQLQTYQFVDENPIEGLSYYRLTTFDLDGAISYKGVRSVETQADLLIYPNPVKDLLFVRGQEGALGEVIVKDVYGRVIDEFISDKNEISINTLLWRQGVYYVITQEGKSYCVLKEE
jgi:hypothetical protein